MVFQSSLVTSSFNDAILEKLPVHNLAAENSFGSDDSLTRRLNTTSRNAVSDRMVIKSAGSSIFGTSEARKIKCYLPKLKEIQKKFDDKQAKKREESIVAKEAQAGLYEKRKLKLLTDCREHLGPCTKPSDVTELYDRFKDQPVYLKKCLKAEVAYARETYTKTPKTDDVFRIRDRTTNKDLTNKQYTANLKTLFSNILAVNEVPTAAVK